MGPLCGKCKREDPLSYMKDSRCYRCEGGEVAVVVSVIVMFFAIPLAVALILYRFTHARALTYRIYRRVFDIGRFKVVCVRVSRAVHHRKFVFECWCLGWCIRVSRLHFDGLCLQLPAVAPISPTDAMRRCGSTIRLWPP